MPEGRLSFASHAEMRLKKAARHGMIGMLGNTFHTKEKQ